MLHAPLDYKDETKPRKASFTMTEEMAGQINRLRQIRRISSAEVMRDAIEYFMLDDNWRKYYKAREGTEYVRRK